MDNTKLKLELEIDNIKVEDGNYSFSYHYTLNGKRKSKYYGSDYEGWTEKQWKKALENGEALKTALQEIAEDFEV